MEGSSKPEEAKPTLKQQMALKEYEILEEAVGRNNTLAYALAGIFMTGVFTASAILIPKLAEQNDACALSGYVVASVVIVLCLWFWFRGIHSRWRAINAIMYGRLQELETELHFDAHRRIHQFYQSEKKGFEWPSGEAAPWYRELMCRLGSLAPRPDGMNTWWNRVVWAITAAYILAFVLAVFRCVGSFLQRLLGPIV